MAEDHNCTRNSPDATACAHFKCRSQLGSSCTASKLIALNDWTMLRQPIIDDSRSAVPVCLISLRSQALPLGQRGRWRCCATTVAMSSQPGGMPKWDPDALPFGTDEETAKALKLQAALLRTLLAAADSPHHRPTSSSGSGAHDTLLVAADSPAGLPLAGASVRGSSASSMAAAAAGRTPGLRLPASDMPHLDTADSIDFAMRMGMDPMHTLNGMRPALPPSAAHPAVQQLRRPARRMLSPMRGAPAGARRAEPKAAGRGVHLAPLVPALARPATADVLAQAPVHHRASAPHVAQRAWSSPMGSVTATDGMEMAPIADVWPPRPLHASATDGHLALLEEEMLGGHPPAHAQPRARHSAVSRGRHRAEKARAASPARGSGAKGVDHDHRRARSRSRH